MITKISLLLICIISFNVKADNINVILEGVTGVFKDNILSNLSLYQHRAAPNLTSGRIRWLYLQASKEINIALQPLGYYDPVIKSTLSQKEGMWQVIINIEKGEPILIAERNIQITGDASTDDVFNDTLKQKLLLTGDVARHDKYEEIKKSLLTIASERGYFDARYLINELTIDTENKKATVKLKLDSGTRYRMGNVTFSDTTLGNDLLQRYIPFSFGDYYHARKIRQLRRILSDSDYFENVVVQPEIRKENPQYIPINVQLSMRRRTKYTLGMGYGTDTGPRASVGLERRFINSRGHAFKGNASVSELINRVTMQYSIPLNNPETDRFIGKTEWREETTATSNSEIRLVMISREKEWSGWRNTISLSYQEETFRVSDDAGRSSLLMPSIGFNQIRSDHPVIPTQGRRLSFNLRGSAEGIVSDSSFLQARAGAKWLTSFNKGRMLLRFDIGASWTQDFSDLPPSVRFFTGGDWSVRGYDYNTLGPQQSNGRVKGGKHLIVGSIEYDYLFLENWRGAVFYDTGNAVDNFNDSLKKSSGVGLRWKSPVGWLRLDFAKPLEATEGWRIHFTIGPDL